MAKYDEELKNKKEQEIASGVTIKSQLPTYKEVTITPEQVAQTRAGLESAAVTNAGSKFNEIYSKLTTPSEPVITYEVDSFGGQVPITKVPGKPAMSAEEAQQEALKRAGLLDVVAGNAPKIDEKSLPKIGTTKTEIKKTDQEKAQAKIDALLAANAKGEISNTLTMASIKAITNPLTHEQELADKKYLLDVKKANADKNGPSKGTWGVEVKGMFEKHGYPDSIGTGDQADIEGKLASLQGTYDASDTDMSNAIRNAQLIYANIGSPGVDENGFKKAVEANLIKLALDKKAKEIHSK